MTKMHEEIFWDIIAKIEGKTVEKRARSLQRLLEKLDEYSILAFHDKFEELRSIPEELIDAANAIRFHGDSSMHYGFIPWLITEGKELYTKSVKKPGLFARFLTEEQLKSRMENEIIMEAIQEAYKKVAGKEMATWWDREIARLYGDIPKEEIKRAKDVMKIISTMSRREEETPYLLASVLRAANKVLGVESWIEHRKGKKPA